MSKSFSRVATRPGQQFLRCESGGYARSAAATMTRSYAEVVLFYILHSNVDS